MSQNSSGNASSQGSSPSLLRVVQQLIESDEQEKNNKKIVSLKNQFSVLKRIYPFSTNAQKLQIFLHDQNFRIRVTDKLIENCIQISDQAPIVKAYLASTRYGAPVSQQFDENDIHSVFQKFGQIIQFHITHHTVYVWFQQSISSFMAVKALNGIQVSEWLRLCVKFCNQQQLLEAYTLITSNKKHQKHQAYSNQINLVNKNNKTAVRNLEPIRKYIGKYQLGIDNLPQFNLAQRLIGPKGTYMKKIIQKVLQSQMNNGKYNINNSQNVLKIRFVPKSPNNEGQTQEKSHIFISAKEKVLFENSCKEIEILLNKVLQEYKLNFQKTYHRYAEGIAYRLFQFHHSQFIQVKHMNLEHIENLVDIVSLSTQPKLSHKIIQQKIQERQKARRNNRYSQADKIRNWLKSKGVAIIDSKTRGQKSSWHYIV